MTTITGQIEIRADDGDVQIEPFSVADTTGTLATWDNTSQTFFVCRKPGQIVDIVASGQSTCVKLKFKVNGKDTGVQKILAGLAPTVNNRMPTTIPIAGGAAVQMAVYS